MRPDWTGAGAKRARAPEVVKSAVRALQILELFDSFQGPASVGKIADTLGYPQSSTSALLRSLVKVNYLSYDAQQRTFMPTPRVALLGMWQGEQFLSDGPLLGLARKLSERCGLVLGAAQRNRDSVQWLHFIMAKDRPPVDPQTLRAELLRSATGLVLLSALSPSTVDGLVRRINAEEADLARLVRRADLHDQLALVRRDGFAHTACDGIGMVAVLAPHALTEEPTAFTLLGDAAEIEAKIGHIVNCIRETLAEAGENGARNGAPAAGPEAAWSANSSVTHLARKINVAVG